MNRVTAFSLAREASRSLNMLSVAQIDRILRHLADAIPAHAEAIIAANKRDLSRMEPSNPLYDRLLLTPERLDAIADDIRNVASLPSPVGEVLDHVSRPNGMKIKKVRVPFGVVGVIYEARPNVSFDVFSLCFKTQSACILKGGSDAQASNEAIVALIKKILAEEGLDEHAVVLLPADREYTAQLLNAEGFVDVIIPRGSAALIRYVRENSRIPVVETGAGVCHTYFDESGDLEWGAQIVFNAKTRRVSVCNSLDCLLVHEARLPDLSALCAPLAEKSVKIYADPAALAALRNNYPEHLLVPADESSFGTEFMDYKMSIRTVAGIHEAMEHIAEYSSKHSEAIVTSDKRNEELFLHNVDAACVYANVSTAFTDGAQFGMGAEIGISTQKLHARGPMALPELTSYKYIITGDGQVRW
ncbi:MAG: glutamate-5-semialdehyde dehydrogenase [Rikenellaceae bacterium]|jgi:glutamate-5-semialdehyde dehydrogenase|nr:glutamate-5-semialdehyde dehydrogenase [Rikenellaceae bacterium]